MLHLSKVSKLQGGRTLFRDATFQVNPGEKVGLVGPNGAGKSTVFRLIVGEESSDEGQISFPSDTRVGYFSQDVGEMTGGSPLGAVLEMTGFKTIMEELTQLESQLEQELDEDEMTRVLERYGDLRTEFDSAGGYEVEIKAETVLSGLGIGPEDQKLPLESFSGGWKMRIAMAGVLVQNPDLLLMDEPTNHLDLESIMWLEEWLASYRGMLVLTSHDREFLNRVVAKIVEVAHQTMTVYSGNYDFYENERELRTEQLLAAHKRQQSMLQKEQEFIARFKARASHAAQVQSRVKKLEKIEMVEIPEQAKRAKFVFQTPPRSGDEVVKMDGLGKTWHRPDGRPVPVFSDFTGVVERLDKVAVVGVNGAGKSTLLKLMAEQTEPTEGTLKLGASLEVGYFSQNSLDLLDPAKTVYEQLAEAMPLASVGQVRTLLGCFLFSGDEVEKRISILSGGEKSRVVLARILARPVNFLILDEPTNHLDMESREILLEALQDFEGTIVLVSHDRHFLKAVSNRVFKVDDGRIQIFEGSYDEFLQSSQGDARAR